MVAQPVSLFTYDNHVKRLIVFTELIVAESVCIIKKLLQTQQGSHGEIVIVQMAKIVTRIAVPQARAAILVGIF